MKYWILKTEPGAYSFSDLERDKKTCWDGVRNFQARNNLAQMIRGDLAMIYHSMGPKEIVGIAKISKASFPDPSDPNWMAIEISFVEYLKKPVKLLSLKEHPKLAQLSLVRQSRLSVCPVTKAEWEIILSLAE